MRKITIELYANSEYSMHERLLEIDRAITRSVWPSCRLDKKGMSQKQSGCIEEEKNYLLSDYEYDKEDPNWNSCSNTVCTGKWKMQIVPDQDYRNFQESPDL